MPRLLILLAQLLLHVLALVLQFGHLLQRLQLHDASAAMHAMHTVRCNCNIAPTWIWRRRGAGSLPPCRVDDAALPQSNVHNAPHTTCLHSFSRAPWQTYRTVIARSLRAAASTRNPPGQRKQGVQAEQAQTHTSSRSFSIAATSSFAAMSTSRSCVSSFLKAATGEAAP